MNGNVGRVDLTLQPSEESSERTIGVPEKIAVLMYSRVVRKVDQSTLRKSFPGLTGTGNRLTIE